MEGTKYQSRMDKPRFTPSPRALETVDQLLIMMLNRDCGINTEYTLKNGPAPGSAPRIFLFEDGKFVRPDEKGMTTRDLVNASMLGKVFVYPQGQKYPLQLQARADEERFFFDFSEPVTPDVVAEMPEEPEVTRQPRWYHRLFKFWGGNRKLCDDYDKSLRDHAQWKTDCENLRKNPPASVLEARALAAQALKAYPGDKKQLAEILSHAVEYTGISSGSITITGNEARGSAGLSQLCGEMLDLAKRDPELEQLAKNAYEAREKAFRERHPDLPLKPLKWEDNVKAVRAHIALTNQVKKGYAARKALLEAERDGVKLTSEQKKGYMKDVLKANIVATQYEVQKLNTRDEKNNPDYAKCVDYALNLRKKYTSPKSTGMGAAAGGSTLPSDMPTILMAGMLSRSLQKPQAMLAVDDPKQVAALDREVENLMEKEGIGEKSLAELNRGLEKEGAYAGGNAVDLLQKTNAHPTAQKTVNTPAKNLTHEVTQQQLGKN